ncbi:cytochrome P450 [Canariomyces notabilis]|uniref:Cytochrome P450 n=1 Tax=Canariomyces notabilis TaxID=2074819 RepID=A0AAN6QGN8_9PEZI|nr:cytochrome P450 [Canariomyces arenarius]
MSTSVSRQSNSFPGFFVSVVHTRPSQLLPTAMAFPLRESLECVAGITAIQWTTLALGAVSLYASVRCFYHLYLHPASRFPGPKLAAISNVWYAYYWVTGKYPMAIAKALNKYGDVVRIGPNELVFISPKAASDIYASHTKHMEHFPKAKFVDLGGGDKGLTWETDPAKHRDVAKRIAPAFSVKSIRSKEPTMHKYIDLFVWKMREVGGQQGGIELRTWTDWVAMDISAELAYGHEMHQVERAKTAPFLDSLWGVNFFVAIHQILHRFPLLSPLQYAFVPPAAIVSELRARSLNRAKLEQRIAQRGATKHADHFDQLSPASAPDPMPREKKHLEVVAAQLLIAGYEPISSQFLCTLMFSLQEPKLHQQLVDEIRSAFARYEDITPDALAGLPLLHAALLETLRLTFIGGGGLPRVSPGATVDGHHIPRGVGVQYAHWAFTRSPRYFHEPRCFRPQRWLPADHPAWDPAFASDATEHFFPFSQGPRSCPGMGLRGARRGCLLPRCSGRLTSSPCPAKSRSFLRTRFACTACGANRSSGFGCFRGRNRDLTNEAPSRPSLSCRWKDLGGR